jgi:uncharacterized membrane protein YhaH (DUF805 family)
MPPLPKGNEYHLQYPDGHSVPLRNNNPLVFVGRWNRGQYVGAVVGYTLVFIALCPFVYPHGLVDWSSYTLPQIFIFPFLWAYLMTCAAVKRMHDINWPAWGVLVLPIMFTWLFLGLVGGNDGPNRYGEKP